MPEVALDVLVREAQHNHVGDMLVRDDLPLILEVIPQSIYRMQPYAGIRSGLQLGVI